MNIGHYIAVAGLLGTAFCAGWMLCLWWRDRLDRRIDKWLAERENVEISFTE